jgi:hypothetical protein
LNPSRLLNHLMLKVKLLKNNIKKQQKNHVKQGELANYVTIDIKLR